MTTENGLSISGEPVPQNRTDPAPNRPVQEGAQRLREAIEGAGGQTRVSRRSGVPLTTLNRLLAGQEMKQSALVALADACRVSVEWLATGRGPMRAGQQNTADVPAPKPTSSAPERAAGLFATVNVDRFAKAVERARKLYEDEGKQPSARGLSQVLLILYDELTQEAETPVPESHTDD